MKNGNSVKVFCKDTGMLDLLEQCMNVVSDKNADIVIEVDEKSVSVNSKLFRKPLRIAELVDYIKRLKSEEGLVIGDLEYFYTRKEVLFADDSVLLTEKENELFNYLINAKKEVASEEILKAIWNYSDDVETTTLDTHLYRLRQKLDAIGLDKIIETTENGYKFKHDF